jgi:4-amino-4-deoxy-L-arabinose transferase-like glycosyltransferase
MEEGNRWYGVMSPGWPAMLALGEVAQTPWLVNPLLAAATILLFASVFRQMGMSRFEAHLAIVFMALSPFVVFMSASYMAHSASLFWFALFWWGWLRLLQAGQLRFALVAGVALVCHAMVRPDGVT